MRSFLNKFQVLGRRRLYASLTVVRQTGEQTQTASPPDVRRGLPCRWVSLADRAAPFVRALPYNNIFQEFIQTIDNSGEAGIWGTARF